MLPPFIFEFQSNWHATHAKASEQLKQWALVQYHPWQNRAESFLATDDKGEPRDPEYVKDFFRNWVESDRCPWYIQEQYDHDNNRTFRQARSAGAQGAGPRASSALSAAGPETKAPQGGGTVEEEEWESSEGEPASETESSESEPPPEGTRLLRQLRGATNVEEVTRQPELQRRTIAARHAHNVYRNTKVTSRAQEEQSAMPAGVKHVWEDSDGDESFG